MESYRAAMLIPQKYATSQFSPPMARVTNMAMSRNGLFDEATTNMTISTAAATANGPHFSASESAGFSADASFAWRGSLAGLFLRGGSRAPHSAANPSSSGGGSASTRTASPHERHLIFFPASSSLAL